MREFGHLLMSKEVPEPAHPKGRGMPACAPNRVYWGDVDPARAPATLRLPLGSNPIEDLFAVRVPEDAWQPRKRTIGRPGKQNAVESSTVRNKPAYRSRGHP